MPADDPGRSGTGTWRSEVPPPRLHIGAGGWILVVLRAVPLAALVFGGLIVLLILRAVERPVSGLHRPVTPWITRLVCRGALWLVGLGYRRRGRPMAGRGALVANHSSWLDIFALNAGDLVYFVSKAEVAHWPGIGWLARATGTVFIRRQAREARAQTETFRARLAAGHRLVFFPEGTSTDGTQVLPFKTTLFAAFVSDEPPDGLSVQPVTLRYHAPPSSDPRIYGWWGDMEFGTHLIGVLSIWRQGSVDVIYHPPISVAEVNDRKALARKAEEQVRAGADV